jgi:ABC-2 type transport system ATP-binding protein
VRRLDDAGIAIEDIALHRPTLDDVFLSLTGHAAEMALAEEEESEPEPKKRGKRRDR